MESEVWPQNKEPITILVQLINNTEIQPCRSYLPMIALGNGRLSVYRFAQEPKFSQDVQLGSVLSQRQERRQSFPGPIQIVVMRPAGPRSHGQARLIGIQFPGMHVDHERDAPSDHAS